MPRESVELFKEQLRSKEMELKKRETEQAKQEAKIKHILEISQKKIELLKTEVAEKDVAIQEAHEMASSLQMRQQRPSLVETASEGTSLGFSEPKAEVVKTVVETKEVVVKDPKLVKALNQLRARNKELTDQISSEQKGKEQLFKERSMLTKEIQRLRKEPNKMDLMKDKVAQIEERSKRAQERYEGLLEEKNNLIQSYEQTLFQASGGKDGEVKKPSEIIKDLKDDLAQLEREKTGLETDLLNEKKRFDSKLAEIVSKMEEEWGKKVKHLQGARQKMAKLADQVMEEGESGWLTTYADMVTLLLTFFILYYSIAAMNMQQFKEAILGEESASIGLLELLNSADLKESIQSLTGLKSNDIVSDVEKTDLDVDTSQAKIVVRVPGLSLFPPASADLQKEGRPILDEVIRVVNKHENYKTHIQGHTDDTPIFTERFPTNWELSAARATAVLRYFVDKGVDPTKLTATGYADTFPLARNDTEPGRAKNRRVEFVLEKEK